MKNNFVAEREDHGKSWKTVETRDKWKEKWVEGIEGGKKEKQEAYEKRRGDEKKMGSEGGQQVGTAGEGEREKLGGEGE